MAKNSGNKAIINKGDRREGEDLYRVLFENVHDGIYQSSPDGKIITANPALVKMLGYSDEEELKRLNIGKDIYVTPSARDGFTSDLSRTGRLKDVELILRKKNGEEIIVLENSHAVVNDNGELLYYEGTLTDITERKIAEEALRESEERYHTLLETLQDGLSLFDMSGRIKYFNQQKKRMLGYDSDEELMKVSTFDMIHPDDQKNLKKIMEELVSNGSIRDKELRVLRKDGTWFWADFSATLIYDRNGLPAFIMDTLKDISVRRKSEEQLKMLKESIDSHYDSAYWMDSSNRFIYVNNAGCRETGYSLDELLGQHVSLLNPSATDENMDRVWKYIRENGSGTGESVHRRKDGSLFPVEIVTTYVNFKGREYSCGFARDITERKKFLADITAAKEKAEESDRLKTAFLHNISHEIRTPMNAIVGFTSLLEASDLSEETRKQYIDIVYQSSNQLFSIISDIVDISNIETGHVRISENEFSINSVIDTLYDQYRLYARETGIRLGYTKGLEGDAAVIHADETKVVQILTNLLNNAFKFTTRGSVDFGYTLKGKTDIEFFVRDTGIGITPEYEQRIFDRFYQVDNSPEKKTEGTGLGLSICKSYVEMMGGKIWLSTKKDSGSEFFFSIPYKKISGKDTVTKKKLVRTSLKIPAGKKILVSEDDDLSYRLMEELLTKHGATVLRASDGREAINAVDNNPDIDLIFMDIKLPLVDGYSAVSEIRKKNVKVPVVAISAYTGDVEKEKAISGGFNGYISKPVSVKNLLRTVKDFLV